MFQGYKDHVKAGIPSSILPFRNEQLHLHVSWSEYKSLVENASLYNMSVSDYLLALHFMSVWDGDRGQMEFGQRMKEISGEVMAEIED